MPGQPADRNLLFGILALQMDFVTRDGLIAAMNAWVLEKHRPIGDFLVDRGALDPKARALLDPMVDLHVARHGGDPVASLAALSSLGGVASDLRRSVAADPDLLASIAHVPGTRAEDPFATRATLSTGPPASGVRFRKVREHASGNLGVVYVARDEELNREVALKEIKERNADQLHSQAKFLLEAEVTGGLEHPGIVPVYGLGHHDDGRPFYAMRFIRGRSLLEAIRRFHADDSLKSDPGARSLALQKLLRRFTDVCNAVAYAHSRGILHRDLKPDNVMVGKYGETLVVDWGLAKALGRSGDPETIDDHEEHLPEASLQPSTADHMEATHAGALVGTPAYMSPEQAAGRLDLLGPTSDVYGLGATLYHLIAGRPPIEAASLGDLLAKIQSGEFPRPRTLAPWLDPALEAICLKAMALKPETRYATARALADDLDRWIAEAPVAAYPEPFIRRARRWTRKHRTAVTTIASTALVAVLLVGAYARAIIDRTRRAEAEGLATLARAEFLEVEARKTSDPGRWSEAIAEARRAEAQLVSGGGGTAARSRARAKLAELQEAFRVVERDRTMVVDLEEARLTGANVKDNHFDSEAKAKAILAAFRSYGIDFAILSNEEAASRVRSSRIAVELIAALDETTFPVTNTLRERPSAIARLADTDKRGADIRDRIRRKDFEAMRQLVAEEAGRRELGVRCRTIFIALAELDPASSLPVLEAIHRANRSDFWLTHGLAVAYENTKSSQLESSIRCYYAAAALMPTSPGVFVNLGNALYSKGEIDAAIASYREAIRLKPDYVTAHTNLGLALVIKGEIDAAIASHREVIRHKPDYAEAHLNLGHALDSKGEIDAAIASYREAIRLKPDLAEAHTNLGFALVIKGEIDAAIASYREAIRLKPDYFEAHFNLGLALVIKGEIDAAIASHREAIRLKPDYAEAHSNLGNALRSKGEIDAAIAAYHEAIRLKPDLAEAHTNLGFALVIKGEIDAAIAAYREAIRLKPDYFEAHFNLGHALDSKGEIDAAIASYREVIRLKPDLAEAHCNLGHKLNQRELFAEALGHLERGHDLGSKRPDWRYPSAQWVDDCRRLVELDAKLPAVLKGEVAPKDADERLALADLCNKKSSYSGSTRLFAEAFAEQPALADNLAKGYRYNAACGAALAGSGRGQDEPAADEASRAELRGQALGWLRADLAARGKVLEGADARGRAALVGTLEHWKRDGDLAGVRDGAGLARLPGAEREAFRALWADVEALRKKASGP